MTVQMIRADFVDAPAVEPLKGTLYDAATVEDGLHWIDPVSVFSTLNCMVSRVTSATCGAAQAKTFDYPTWVSGARFAAYGGVICQGVGGNEDLLGEAEAAWNGGVETRAVEQGLVENVLSEVAAGNDKTPTPGTPVAPAAGLAILEEWAAQHYAGVATMHIPRGIAQYLSQNGALKTDGSDWRTMVGSKVSAGGGYGLVNKGPNNAAAVAGAYWMWATGETVVRRSGMIARNELNRTTNENIVLVEREFIVAVDCMSVAVQVKVP